VTVELFDGAVAAMIRLKTDLDPAWQAYARADP